MTEKSSPADWILGPATDVAVALTTFNLGRRDAGSDGPWWGTLAPVLVLAAAYGVMVGILWVWELVSG